jgi:hypothetical protein
MRFVAVVAVVLWCTACPGPSPSGGGGGGLGGGTGGGSTGGGGGGGGGGIADGGPQLPCGVANLVGEHCLSCHGPQLAGGAPFRLDSYAALTKVSDQPPLSCAEAGLTRLRNPGAPMPPAPDSAPPAEEVQALADWIDAGYPAGSCSIDAGSVCVSGRHWPQGGSDAGMFPGQTCVGCHLINSPPNAYYFAGTVFPGFVTADGCEETLPAGVTVEIYDANGQLALTMNVGENGNFVSPSPDAGVTLPYKAHVVFNGQVRAMTLPQVSGDCNSCHTQTGASGAPGRIHLP